MPAIKLSHLQSQIAVLFTHFNDRRLFIDGLLSLFQMYSQGKNPTNIWLREFQDQAYFNIPPPVIAELQSNLESYTVQYPAAAKEIIDTLWEQPEIEPKLIAIKMLSHLPESLNEFIISHLSAWISEDTDDYLFDYILECGKGNLPILLSEQWLQMIEGWINSSSIKISLRGIQAINQLVENREYDYLPGIFNLIHPLFRKPEPQMKKDLVKIIKTLITRSEAETASFVISTAEIYANNEVRAFCRKCIPFFSTHYQEEIKRAL